jgi:hypothetical protein
MIAESWEGLPSVDFVEDVRFNKIYLVICQ